MKTSGFNDLVNISSGLFDLGGGDDKIICSQECVASLGAGNDVILIYSITNLTQYIII